MAILGCTLVGLVSLFIGWLCLFIQISVPYRYEGEHADLYTVAVRNLFGTDGIAEGGFDPFLEILETDDYGRTLFLYDEDCFFYTENQHGEEIEQSYFAYLIMQKSDGKTVWYYEDACCQPFLSNAQHDEEIPELSELKARNDWGKVFAEDKCTTMPVVTDPAAPYDRSDILKTIANRYIDGIFPDSTETSPFRYAVFCTQDGYGRELWYVHAVDGDIYGEGISPSSTARRFDLAIILAPDGNRNSQNCVIEIENMIESPQQIAAFKRDNGWNTYLTQ